MARNESAKREKQKKDLGIKRKITAMLELPKEIVFNLPILSMLGNEEVNISNYKGIIEYTDEMLKISVGSGVIRLEGGRLVLRQITSESISVTGRIRKIEFLL